MSGRLLKVENRPSCSSERVGLPLSPTSQSGKLASPPVISCVKCGLIPREDWVGVPAATIGLIERRKAITYTDKGTVLFHQGDRATSLYRLLSGLVLLRKLDHDGNGIATHMVEPGETFGFRAFVQNAPHTVTAQCATDTLLCRIPAEVARTVFLANHALKRVFARHVAAELTQTETALQAMLDLPVRTRLLRLFARLARLYGEQDHSGACRFVLPLLRSDIASLTGIARESYSRRIASIEAAGLLFFEQSTVVIPDLDRLEAEASVWRR